MTYSFTQISQYLRCPRKYRYRYLDGWREKEDRASMIFGRCFENALAAYFREEDSTAVFFKEWQEHQDAALQYAKNDSWDRLYHQGVRLLERFAQDDRVRIRCPKKNLQVKCTRSTSVRKRICILRRCDWRAGRDELHPRLENDRIALSGTARWSLVARSTAGLLLLDDWNRGCLSGGVCSQNHARNSVSEDIHR